MIGGSVTGSVGRCNRLSFAPHGFREGHAAAFALMIYTSARLKCWHPDVFCGALLNSQPIGFHAPAQFMRDAQAHEVAVWPARVATSRWDCTEKQGL